MPRIWRISSPRSTPLRRPTRRTALWAALALLALGFVVIVLIAFGVFPQARVTSLIETRAKQALGEQSRIGRMRVVPARGEAEVWDSVVAGPGYHVELPRARFVFGLGALFGGELVIQKLELENPRVVIDPVPGSGGAKGRPITVLDLRVSHGSLLYKDLAGGDLQLVDVSGSGDIGRGILELRAASGEWRRPVRVPLGPLHARVALTPRLEARLESLDAATGSSRIHLSGAIGALSDPVLDLAFEADVDLKDAQLFGGPSDTTGRVHTRGRISGSPRDLRVEAHGTSPRVDSGGLTLHGVDADLELGGDTRKTLQLASRIGASVPDVWGGTTRGNVTLSGAYTPSLSRTELRWRAALERRPPGTRAPGPGFVTARAEGTASGGTPLRIDGRMSGEVVSPGASAPLRVPFTGTFASLGRRIAADVDLRQAPGFLRASLDADAGAIKSLRLRGEDLDLVPLLGASGRASLNAAFSGQPQRASGSASASLRGLAYRGSSLGDAELRLSLRNGRGPLQLELPALRARGSGELTLAGGGSLRASVTLDRTPLAPLAAAFQTAPATPLVGELTAVADVTASLADWRRADVRLNASQLSLQNGTLQARAGPFTAVARDGVADVQGLSLELPGGRIEASGRLALGAGTNDLVLRVAADVQNVPNVKLPQGWQVQGRATGQLRLTGSFERPWLVGNVQLLDIALRRGQRQVRIFELPKAEVLAQGDRVVFGDVVATLAGGSVKASGELRLSTVAPTLFPQGDLAQPAQLQVEWHEVQAAVLSRAFGWRGDQVVDAALSGHFVVEGRRARLIDLSGHGSMAAVHGTAAGVSFDVDELAVRVERGIATLDSFALRTGTETLRGNATLDASSLALTGSATGKVDLRALSALTSPTYLSGDAALDLRLSGTLIDPRPSGRITLDRASARSPEFAQALTEMRGVLLLEPGLWRLEDITGRFGGGDVRVTGSVRPVGPSAWADVNFAITAKDVALRYPQDFKSRLTADLRLVGETGALQLQGDVLVDGGLYDTDIFLYQALLSTDESLLRPAASPLVEPLAALRAIGLDIQARLANPFLVRNNVAKLALTGQLRVRGDLAEPAPYGRLEIAEGGLLFLQTRTFTVDGGSLIFEGTREPTISVTAQGVIRQAGQEDVSVTVAASGPMERPRLSLNSDPPYTEREIASLIATGRRNVALDSSAWVAGEQGLALLASPLTRGVQRGLLDLGLDEVDIQPELLARETNPGARFTFGKNITPDMKLIFSRGLKDPESTFYQLEYRMSSLYNVTARVQSDDRANITAGLGQRFRFGGPTKPKSEVLQEKRVTLKAVSFVGDKPLGEDVLRDAIKVKIGQDVTTWDIQDDADRLERLLIDAQYIEALVSARVEDASAVFAISAGPRFRAEVIGLPSPPPLASMLKAARFEGQALEQGRKLLLDDARARGYGRAKLEAAVRDDPGWRTLSFKVELGPPTQVTVTFPGARALSAQRLLAAAGGAPEFLSAPQRARRQVAREYRAELYLSVRVGEPEVSESADHASVTLAVPVQEGAKARIARIRFDGAQTPESVLVPLTGIAPGSDYVPDKVLLAVQHVREYYLKSGYAAVRLRHRLVPAAPDVELHFQVSEGERDTIGPVVVTGLRRTRESLVRNRIDFKQGDPLDPRKLVELERRLMELGMFSRVAVSTTGENPRTIKVEVEERGPYMVNYDLRFSQDERATVLVDGEIGNLAGLGIVAGGRYRQGLALREARGSLVLPALGRARGITLSAFDRAGDVGLTGEPRRRTSVGPFERRTERGAGLQHSLQLKNKWETAYSYTLKRVGTTAGSGLQKNLGILEASIVADGRDDVLNPTRGMVWSVNLGLSPKALGSQLPFSRAMGQVSVTLPVGRQLTWAQGYRIGVASVLKGKTLEEIRLIGREEGFRAGGGSSVRGYATDSLGPRDLLPGTAAGDAVAIVNQELRYQLPAGFGAAVFYDAGNVFARKEDLTLKLRQSVGVGVRYLSPFGLVRVDVGFPIGRRPGEKPQFFLSLGQAF